MGKGNFAPTQILEELLDRFFPLGHDVEPMLPPGLLTLTGLGFGPEDSLFPPA